MRGGAVVLVSLVGCYHPTLTLGAPCDEDRDCPASQRCLEHVCGGPQDAALGGPDDGGDAPPAEVVVLDERFTAGLDQWATLGGTWTTDASGARIAIGNNAEAALLLMRPLFDVGSRVTLTVALTVDNLPVSAADHLLGAALIAGNGDGLTCTLSQQSAATAPHELLLWEAGDAVDIASGVYPWQVGVRTTLRLTYDVRLDAPWRCTVPSDAAAPTPSGAGAAPGSTPGVMLYATGLTGHIHSIQVVTQR